MAVDSSRIAAALRAQSVALGLLADALETDAPAGSAAPAADPAPAAAPAKRGRGRPVKGEDAPATAGQPPAAAAAAPAPAEPDPFATAPVAAPAAPTATLEEVRAALTALREATDQNRALEVLKAAGGAIPIASTDPSKFGAILVAVKAARDAAVQPEVDPFADPAPAAAPAKPITKEELKALCVETGKRTSQDKVLKVVFDHGGKGPAPTGSGEVASFHALPESQYAAVAAALKALPSTK